MLLPAMHELCWEESWEMEWGLTRAAQEGASPIQLKRHWYNSHVWPSRSGVLGNTWKTIHLFIHCFVHLHLQYCIPTISTLFQNIFITSEGKPVPYYSPYSPLSCPWQWQVCILSLWTWWFWVFHINESCNMCNMWNSVSGFFHLAWCCWDSSML